MCRFTSLQCRGLDDCVSIVVFMRKARDTILRLTLKKLRMLKPGLESSKVSVRLEMGGQCKSIPNPRFVNGGGAEFYGCKL